MVRKAINILSPIAALALIWVSMQSFVLNQDEEAAAVTAVPIPATVPTTLPESLLLEELPSVSRVLDAQPGLSPGAAVDAGVPESVRRVLVGSDAVLLLPVEAGQ